jgi:hypothetical protein
VPRDRKSRISGIATVVCTVIARDGSGVIFHKARQTTAHQPAFYPLAAVQHRTKPSE